jgi:hypothetical protein
VAIPIPDNFVGEAAAEVEPRLVHTLAPAIVRLRHAAGRSAGHGDHLQAQPREQRVHLRAEAAARGDDQRFRDGYRRDQQLVLRFQHRHAGVGRRLVEQDRHPTPRCRRQSPG